VTSRTRKLPSLPGAGAVERVRKTCGPGGIGDDGDEREGRRERCDKATTCGLHASSRPSRRVQLAGDEAADERQQAHDETDVPFVWAASSGVGGTSNTTC